MRFENKTPSFIRAHSESLGIVCSAGSTFMRDECLTNKFVFGEDLPVSRLVGSVAEKMQSMYIFYLM